jgi:hypothetical protein
MINKENYTYSIQIGSKLRNKNCEEEREHL